MKERKVTGIKSWPEDDRPREKLLKKGEEVAYPFAHLRMADEYP